jgi:glyoxylase-like metal-dependent hydrolase (beta-lactamase superfamily II)
MSYTGFSRRETLGGGFALSIMSMLPKGVSADSNYRFMVGESEVTILSDGFISVPGEMLVPDETSERRAQILERVDAPGGVVRSKANIPLIKTQNDLILVDIGAGHKYQASDGRLTASLGIAGVRQDDITKIVFTHAHPDHIWATLSEEGGLRFPNATYYVGALEWNFWMDPDYLSKMPAALHDFARGARRDLDAVRERAVMLNANDEVITGLRALDTAGHTPGHFSLELAGREGLLIAADVATNEIVSFEHPDWKFGYDTIPELAIKNRIRLLDQAATEKTKLLGYHWAYPGIGYAERKGTAFRFVSAL